MSAGLVVEELRVSYSPRDGSRRRVLAVDRVSLEVGTDEVLALVGESGSGKSTLVRALVGLVQADSGHASFDGRGLLGRRSRADRSARDVAMIFQDPRTSLNPRMTVRQSVAEVWRAHPDVAPGRSRSSWDEALSELLGQVGLDPEVTDRRPGALSGGQCQRVSIARALAMRPRLLICDEAVSALDVSVQAQILRLLMELHTTRGLSMLFITHDLGVVRQIADRVAVMQNGSVVETAVADVLFTSPEHPYTRELLSAALDLAPGSDRADEDDTTPAHQEAPS